jgi:hypothetical protein
MEEQENLTPEPTPEPTPETMEQEPEPTIDADLSLAEQHAQQDTTTHRTFGR